MKPSEYLKHCVLYDDAQFHCDDKYTEAKNIVDSYLTQKDSKRGLIWYDYLMFVWMCAEDLADETMSA